MSLYAPTRHVTDLDQCYFYHTMDLPGLGTVSGQWDLRGRFADYSGHVPLRGCRVLDVGCASGFLTFEAEAAGATVVSFDMDTPARQHLLPFADSLYMTNHAAWVTQQRAGLERWKNAYWLAHRLYASHAQVVYGDIYALPPALGPFDVVLVGAVLEHLSDPIRALAALAPHCTDTLVCNLDLLPTEEPVAHFVGRHDHPEANYTFWVYSLGLYRQVFAMLGFQIARLVAAAYPSPFLHATLTRTALVATRLR